MGKKKTFKALLLIGAVAILIASAVIVYLFNKPQRDVQSSEIEYRISASDLVAEYLKDQATANKKYLDDEGNSKIIAVTGTVKSLEKDLNNQWVVLLKKEGDKAGVNCSFTSATNHSAEKLLTGQVITIKGVIRAGAGHDSDLDLFEDVIIEKSDVLNEN